jgi:hypothetical protein
VHSDNNVVNGVTTVHKVQQFHQTNFSAPEDDV